MKLSPTPDALALATKLGEYADGPREADDDRETTWAPLAREAASVLRDFEARLRALDGVCRILAEERRCAVRLDEDDDAALRAFLYPGAGR